MKKFVIGCAGFAVLLASPVFAAERSDAEIEGVALKAVLSSAANKNAGYAMAVAPAAAFLPTAVVPMIGNFMDVGPDETPVGLPCFYCAPSPNGGYGVSLTIPSGYIPTSVTAIDYSFMFQDLTVTSTCTLAFALMQGSTVLDTAQFPNPLYPATWVVTFPRTTPTASGQATAIGFIICGGVKQATVSTKIVLQ